MIATHARKVMIPHNSNKIEFVSCREHKKFLTGRAPNNFLLIDDEPIVIFKNVEEVECDWCEEEFKL